jgi:predicted permease
VNAERIVRGLIRLYPVSFRERYGAAMLAFHRERAQEGIPLRRWPRIVLDHVLSAAAEHTHVLGRALRGPRQATGLSDALQELRHAARALLRRPAFTTAVVVTIAVGVGANTAIFSVVRGILLRPLPYPDAERVVSFGLQPPLWLASAPEFADYQSGLASLETLAAYTQGEGNLGHEEQPERIALATVTPGFFEALAVTPRLGRVFAADEDVGPERVVILSHALWRRRFAESDEVIGQSISLNDRPFTVVGVMPANFDYPSARTDVWLPLRRFTAANEDRSNHYLFMVGRLRDGATLASARGEAEDLASEMFREHGDRYDPAYPPTPVLTPVGEALLSGTRPYLWALLGAVGFVLLIACANVGNLLLARGEGRRKEMALRGALGANRRRLFAQLLGEAALLALVGGAAGIALAFAMHRLLLDYAPPGIPRLDEVDLDGLVVLYGAFVTGAAALVFGLLPAARVSRAAPGEMLKQAGRGQPDGGSRRTRDALIIAQVALALVMTSGAAMLVRSLVALQSSSMGFESRRALTAKISLTPGRYDDTRAALFFSELTTRVRALPGVVAAGAAGWLPVVEAGGLWGVLAEGQSYEQLAQGPLAVPQQVTPGYFAAMGIPLLRGRDVSEQDGPTGPFVAVVSQAMADMLWPTEDPVGRRFRVGDGATFVTVVGVVGDIRSRGFDDTPEPTMYFPYAQTGVTAYFMPRSLSLVIRAEEPELPVVDELQRIVRSLDASVPVSSVRSLEDVVGTAVASRRLATTLIGGFAVAALLLAGLGIFSVVSYGVSQRGHEIGVRVALGAERAGVLRLVVADSLRTAGVGLVIGLIGVVPVARLLRPMLFEVPHFGVTTIAAACAGLVGVVSLAALFPARRAAAVDPADALRSG